MTLSTISVSLLAVGIAAGSNVSATQESPESVVELQREQILAALSDGKKINRSAAVIQVLDLTEEQSKAFWPVYRAYEEEHAALVDERIALIRNYAADYIAMTNEKAAVLGERSLVLQEKQLALERRLHTDLTKAIGAINAVRTLQAEHQMNRLDLIEAAARLPLIRPPNKE